MVITRSVCGIRIRPQLLLQYDRRTRPLPPAMPNTVCVNACVLQTTKNAILLYRLQTVDPATANTSTGSSGTGGSLIGRTLTGIGHALFGSGSASPTGSELEAALCVPQFRSIRLVLTSKLRINPVHEAITAYDRRSVCCLLLADS